MCEQLHCYIDPGTEILRVGTLSRQRTSSLEPEILGQCCSIGLPSNVYQRGVCDRVWTKPPGGSGILCLLQLAWRTCSRGGGIGALVLNCRVVLLLCEAILVFLYQAKMLLLIPLVLPQLLLPLPQLLLLLRRRRPLSCYHSLLLLTRRRRALLQLAPAFLPSLARGSLLRRDLLATDSMLQAP